MTAPKTADAATDAPLIYLVAGEPSGDVLGARLMAALKRETGGAVRFAGVGGEHMRAEGLESLFPMREVSVMGLIEVLPHIPRILKRVRDTARDIARKRPAALVTIDSPDFTLRISKRIGGLGIKRIHYVAPSVWAWKPGRAKKIAAFLDHLLALLPFEPPYFEVHGLKTTMVGHPALEQAGRAADGAGFRRRHGIPPDAKLLCVLPGSRRAEIARHAPIFGKTVAELARRIDGLHVVVPTVDAVRGMVEQQVVDWPVPAVVVGPDEKHDAFAASDAALAVSGTVALELAVARVPTIVTYKLGWLTAHIAVWLIRVKYVSLVNLALNREAQPEYVQHLCLPRLLAPAVAGLFEDPWLRDTQLEASDEALRRMGLGNEAPSTRAARAVLATIGADPAARKAYTDPKSAARRPARASQRNGGS